VGGHVLDTDPAVETAGLDAGFSPRPNVLRAPDIAVGGVPDKPGWIPGAPALAVEYASVGQDEDKLSQKIDDLLAAGTKAVWVVRLVGPRRVEVHEKGRAVRTLGPGAMLSAPGILQNEVPVEALYDRALAHKLTLRNLLQREGYESLNDVRKEGHEEGRKEVLLQLLRARFGELPEAAVARVSAANSSDLDIWIRRLLTTPTLDAVFSH
jgi:hypothetical protein